MQVYYLIAGHDNSYILCQNRKKWRRIGEFSCPAIGKLSCNLYFFLLFCSPKFFLTFRNQLSAEFWKFRHKVVVVLPVIICHLSSSRWTLPRLSIQLHCQNWLKLIWGKAEIIYLLICHIYMLSISTSNNTGNDFRRVDCNEEVRKTKVCNLKRATYGLKIGSNVGL